jgi:hypothetical protein
VSGRRRKDWEEEWGEGEWGGGRGGGGEGRGRVRTCVKIIGRKRLRNLAARLCNTLLNNNERDIHKKIYADKTEQ